MIGIKSSLLVCALIGAAVLLDSAKLQAQGSPNVIVIVADDAGYADWGFMNGVDGSNPTPTDIPTPNLDALAARGVKFSRAYVAANCQPTRAALVTGGYQNRIGNENVGNNYYLATQGFAPRGVAEGVPSATETVWERMKTQGYSTAAMGKWHLGSTEDVPGTVQGNRPEHQGVDEFFGMWHGDRQYYIGTENSQEQRLRNTIVDSLGNVTDTNEEANYNGQYFTTAITDYAIDYIDRQTSASKPFFLYQSYTAPHTPMNDSPDFNDPRITGLTGARRQYASMMLTMDKDIGRLLDRLDDPNGDGNMSDSITNDTLVVFLNDNGGAEPGGGAANASDNGQLRGRKGDSWDGGIRVPMIVAGAGIDQSVHGTTYDRIVHGVDILPTAFAAAGGSFAPTENKIDGVDLRPHINGTDTSDPHEVLVHRWRGRFAVINQDWKLVKNTNAPDQNIQLYNITNDVDENSNQAGANPSIVAEMLRDLTDHEAFFDKPRYEILSNTDEQTINIFDHFRFNPTDPGPSSGQVDIIKGATGNGNFEDKLGAVPGTNTTWPTSEMPSWVNLSGAETQNSGTNQGMTASPEPGSYGAFIFQSFTLGNESGHTINSAGEVFDLSFALSKFGNQNNYDGDEDAVITLFSSNTGVNDGTDLGDLQILASESFNVSDFWTDEGNPLFYTSTAGDIGKTVYLGITLSNPTGNNVFPRIDVVELTASVSGGSGMSTTNWSAGGAWFEGGTNTVETMLESDAFAGAVLEFPTTDTFSYVSNNDMVRMTGQTFMLNKFMLTGTFNGTANQSATIQGNEVLFTNDLNGVGPQIAIDSSNGGSSSYTYEIDLNVTMYDHLTITGDGDTTLTINGEISDYFEPRGLTKSGSSTAILTANNSYEGDTTIAEGTLSITNAYLEDTADVYLETGAILDLDFSGTDTIDSLFIDGISQAIGTWGAVGSGANNETSLLTGSGLLLISTLDALGGDFDLDGDVDGADFLKWQRDGGSLTDWQNNYGTDNSNTLSNAGAVPEPSGLLLTFIAVSTLGWGTFRRRRDS